MIRKSALALVAGFAALDALFLRHVFAHFANWGFWDWDYQMTLLEVSRRSVADYGQIPLWNPYLGGGVSLAGDPLNHVWSPSFLWILAFGTVAGAKCCIAAYLALAQWGAFRLARHYGQGVFEATLVAIVFSLGGVYAQRLAHGQFEWIAIAWIPFVMRAIDRAIERFDVRSVCAAGVFFAAVVLDGGPYQFAFFGVFLALYGAIRAVEQRSARPLVSVVGVALIGGGLSAVKLIPVLELVSRFPRTTSEEAFYGAPFQPGIFAVLYQMFLSPAQAHDPKLWMPYVLNVGSYVGIVPLALVAVALVRTPKPYRAWIAGGALALWISLGPAAPIDLWHGLHRLPGFSMLRVPSRFNVYVLLALALLAGAGLAALRERIRNPLHARIAAITLVAATAANLLLVDGEIFRVAFSIPPLAIDRPGAFENRYAYSPFIARYREAVLYDVHPNWPSGSFPAVLENRGVRWPFKTFPYPSYALSMEDPGYRGEVWIASGEGKLEDVSLTPNRIHITTDGGAALVRVNTNYDAGWRVAGGPALSLAEVDGTIGVNVPSGRRSLVLVYRPASFAIGCAVSLLSLAGVVIALARRDASGPPA